MPAGPPSAPSESPSASPSPTPSTVSSPPTLAAITQQELSNATLSLPSWSDGNGCPSGTVKLHNGQFGGGHVPSSQLLKAASVDLDRDGSADSVAIFICHGGDPGLEMAMGFHRAPDGSIQTLGKVVTGIYTIPDVRAGAAGTVQLQVSDLAGSDGVAATGQVKQWRTYQWDGTRFNQTAGSTSFTTSIPALAVTLSDLTPLQEQGENLIQIRIGDQKLAIQPPLGKVILK